MKKAVFTILILCIGLAGFAQKRKTKPGLTGQAPVSKNITIYTTAQNTNMRITPMEGLFFKKYEQPIETEISVMVNPLKKFQSFMGIGGAVTDASAEVFDKLPEAKKTEFLDAYYNKTSGIGYTLMRTNINSCDFSSSSYTYVSDNDKALSSFTVAHDKQFRIPLIKKALQTAGRNITIFASPWSPPAFMKDNNDVLHGGRLLPAYYQSWANYYVKFIKAYAAEGINIWGFTVQNEPLASQKWESCQYTPQEERDFVKYFLGPALHKQGLQNKKIIVWDHNRDFINNWADVILGDPAAAKYVWGVGFHWYETWTGGQPMFTNVGKVRESYPAKNLLFTEGCVERFDPQKFDFWPNAERYGSAMINDFNNGTVGWTDWNILLDENGGPNHVNNFCFAPIHANVKTGELIYTPSYYYIGHFSKFIRPGARRIAAVSTRSSLICTAFLNPDGKIATVVMNQGDLPVKYKLYIGPKMVEVDIPSHAIQTLVY